MRKNVELMMYKYLDTNQDVSTEKVVEVFCIIDELTNEIYRENINDEQDINGVQYSYILQKVYRDVLKNNDMYNEGKCSK